MARLPFLQVPMEAFPRARMLARYLGQHEASGIGLYVMLDEWALSSPPELNAEGVLMDAEPAEVLACALRWQGDPSALLSALLRSKVIEQTTDGFRLLGWEKYAKALAGKSARSVASAIAATERWGRKSDASRMTDASPTHDGRMPPGCVVDAKTQTQTQTQKEETASASQAPASAAPPPVDDLPDATDEVEEVSERPVLELVAPGAKKPRKPSDAERLYAGFQALRKAQCEEAGVPFVDEGWHPSRMNKALGTLAKHPAGSREAVLLNAALAEYLADPQQAKRDTPWSVGWFLTTRSDWEGRALRAAGGGS